MKEKVNVIQDRVKSLNKAIFAAVSQFEIETGLQVGCIDMHRDPFFCDPGPQALFMVDCDVRIQQSV